MTDRSRSLGHHAEFVAHLNFSWCRVALQDVAGLSGSDAI